MIALGSMLRDRDYFKDVNGNILRVIGDYHPNNGLIALVKYYPNSSGCREIKGIYYGYNTFLNNSLSIMKDEINRIRLSVEFGVTVCYTPKELITNYYSCREKTIEILENKGRYINHPVGHHLISFLEKISTNIDINCIGITGSFLFDAFNEQSDIDLVCYGNKTYQLLVNEFNNNDYIQKYDDGLQDYIYKRRMKHMHFVDFETLITQESRKLQGRIRDTGIHINFTPLRDDKDIIKDFSVIPMGEIKCIISVTDDNNGRFSPAVYKINVQTVIYSTLYDISLINKLNILISYNGDYCQVYRCNDYVYVEGRIVKINYMKKDFWGIDITPWDIGSENRSILIKYGK